MYSIIDTPQPALVEGALCLGQFSDDGQWYRALVDKVCGGERRRSLSLQSSAVYDQVVKGPTPKYQVTFVDFGNRETLQAPHIKALDAQTTAVQALATPSQLAFVKVPDLDSDDGVEAANFLCDALGGGRPVTCFVERLEPEGGRRHAVLPKTR